MGRKKITRKYEDELEKPPDSTTVSAPDVLREMIEEDSVSGVVPVKDALNILLILAYPLPVLSIITEAGGVGICNQLFPLKLAPLPLKKIFKGILSPKKHSCGLPLRRDMITLS